MQMRLNMIRYMYTNIIWDQHINGGVYYQPLIFEFPEDAYSGYPNVDD